MKAADSRSEITSQPGSHAERARQVATLSAVRWAAIAFAAIQVLTFYRPYPGETFKIALAVVAIFFIGNVVIGLVVLLRPAEKVSELVLPSLVLDTTVVAAFVFVYGFDPATSIWAVLYILPLEGALLYQRRGALAVMTAAGLAYAIREVSSHTVYGFDLEPFSITFRLGIGYLIAMVAGATTERLVSERNAAAAAQREAFGLNQQLRTLLSNLPGMAYRCRNDADWSMVFVSQGIEELTGYPSEKFISHEIKYADLIHPEDRDEVQRLVQAGVEAGRSFRLEYRILRKDGTEHWVWEQGRQVSDGYLEGLVIDTSERKRLEDALLQAQKMDAIGRIAGGVAHDFNNLLSVIQNYAHFVKEGLDEATIEGRNDLDEIGADVAEIEMAASRGAALISQLLAFSRRDASQPLHLHLADSVNEIERLLRRAVRESISLGFEIGETGWVFIGRSQLEQILLNLVVNAGDAMPEGGDVTIKTGTVSVDEEFAAAHVGLTPGEYATVAVGDTGHGIEPEKLPKIFEPFFTTKERGAGTGLGLASVYGTVKKANGYVEVESEIGRGTTFTIYLPSVPEGAVMESPVADPPRAMEGTGKVLVVEDEPGVRTTIDRILSRAGFDVSLAPDPMSAITTAEARSFDLLITDLVMPGMSGWTLVDRLTEAGTLPPVVLYISGYDDALAAGVRRDVCLLQKPFSGDQLLTAIRDATNEPR